MKIKASILTLCLSLSGCQFNNVSDPLEPINRPIFYVNVFFDELIFKPITELYVYVTPSIVQTGVHNFSSNINDIKTVPLQLLVGEWDKGFDNTIRLLLNTTVGIGGLIDVSGAMGLHNHPIDMNDVGNTYGFKPIYVVLPLLGPTTSFNLITTVGQSLAINELASDDARIAISIGQGLDARAQMLPFDALIAKQKDPYNYVKSMIMNKKDKPAEFSLPEDV